MKTYLNQTNFFGGNNPEELARVYGTPLYVYNEDILRTHMRAVAKVITKYPYTANYSIKANSNLAILKIALEEGINCDAMSTGEIELLLHVGFPKERIFYVPNNVEDWELQFAIDRGIMTSLDSLSQLRRFGRLNRGGRCAIRVNPGVGAGHHEKVVTAGKKTKFAICIEDMEEALAIAEEYKLKIVGINQHIGSLFMEPTPYLAAVEAIFAVAARFKDLEFIDFGGGYGIPYHKHDGEKEYDMADFSARLVPILDRFVETYGKTPLFKSEPGRYCVAESAVILGRVTATKENSGVKYVGTNVGMNVLVRPSMYDAYHEIEVIREGKVVEEEPTETVTVVGNICESGDILAKDRKLPAVKEGDLIAVLDSGAYGYSMCSSYNARPKAAEVMICADGSVKQIRKRETIEEIIASMTF